MKCATCNQDVTDVTEGACPHCWTPFLLSERCRNCGYDLTGLTESRCPECGTPFTRKIADARYTLCTECFYDLVGNTSGRCPECGVAYTAAGIDRFWTDRVITRKDVIKQLLAPFVGLMSLGAVGDLCPPLGFVLLLIGGPLILLYSAPNCYKLARCIVYTQAFKHPERRARINPHGLRVYAIAVGLFVLLIGIPVAIFWSCVGLVNIW